MVGYQIIGPDNSYTPGPATAALKIRRNGFCRVSYDSGDVYEGEFKDGRREGAGTLYFNKPGGTRYEGQFKNDLFEGTGVYQ